MCELESDVEELNARLITLVHNGGHDPLADMVAMPGPSLAAAQSTREAALGVEVSWLSGCIEVKSKLKMSPVSCAHLGYSMLREVPTVAAH